MTGVGEALVRAANRKGLMLFVDTDRLVKYYPSDRMSKGFLKLINRHYFQVYNWLIADAVSGG